MSKKKILPLAILAGVVAVLAVILAIIAILNREEEDTGIPLFSVAAEDVTAISYQEGDTDVSLTKGEDGSWTLDSDPLLPIDDQAVGEVLTGVTGMTAMRQLSDGEGDVDSMGLDAPTRTISFTAGDTDYTITVGAENSMAEAYYAQVGDSLYTVSTSTFVGLCKTPRQLYEAQDITDIESTEVASMTVDTGAETLDFQLDSDGNWTLADDPDYDLDQDAVSRMANTICSLTTEWSITSPGADSEYGLDSPNAVVTLTATDGRSVRCVFGSTASDDSDTAYLRASNDESVVYEIAANHLSSFACTKESLKAATPETATGEEADS